MARPMRFLLAGLLAFSLLAVSQPVPADPGHPVAAAKKRPGKPSDYSWLFGRKIMWENCGPLTYRVNPARAPKGWKPLVKKSVKKVKQATGLKFRYLGKSKVKPSLGDPNPPDTDILIAFLNPGQTDMLQGAGVAGQGSAASDGQRIFDGKVVLNAKVLKKMAPGFGAGPRYGIQGSRGQVVMHELGHVLGLGHARHQPQIMFPTATRKPAEWGAGDWKGLRKLGKGGCSTSRSTGPRLVRSLS